MFHQSLPLPCLSYVQNTFLLQFTSLHLESEAEGGGDIGLSRVNKRMVFQIVRFVLERFCTYPYLHYGWISSASVNSRGHKSLRK